LAQRVQELPIGFDSNGKYLIVGILGGDMVMATKSFFITLKNVMKKAIIDLLGPKWSSPILARMPEIRVMQT